MRLFFNFVYKTIGENSTCLILRLLKQLSNFNRQTHNSFGVATETTLLFVPNELDHRTPKSSKNAEIMSVNGLDEIAAVLLASPRYGGHSAHDRDPVYLRAALSEAEELKTRLEFRNAVLTAEFWEKKETPCPISTIFVAPKRSRRLKSSIRRVARFLKLRS